MARAYPLAVVALLAWNLPAAAQDNAIDRALARQYFRQLEQTSDRDAGRLWGRPLYGPILLVDPNTRAVVANQADPERRLAAEDEVFVGRLPDSLNIANTDMRWAGTHWTMVRWPVPELRQPRERLLLHECFHRVQDDLGLPGRDAVNAHLDMLDGRIWLQMEWRALERALRASGSGRRAAIEDALVFRGYRRSLFPDAAKNETALELNEGLAEYTGVRLSSADSMEMRFRSDLILRQARSNPTFARSFAYVSGPAYGALLDLSGRPWRTRLNASADLGALLAEAYGLKVQASEERARAAAPRYEGDEIIALETRQEQERQRHIADARRRFLDAPVLVLQLSPDVQYSFDPNNVLSVDARHAVYPGVRVTDAWGILTAPEGALLERDEAGRVIRARVPAPADESARPLKGQGWSLDLKAGWEVAPGDRSGDLSVRAK
jgi:hypothetical protein